MILGFIFLVLDHIWLLSKIIFPENWPPDFPFKYLPLLFTDLFYFAYLTLVYKRAKSKDGFIQTKTDEDGDKELIKISEIIAKHINGT